MSKINDDMNSLQICSIMSEGNLGAMKVCRFLLKDNWIDGYLFKCDELDIRGEKIYKLFFDCCDGWYNKFSETMRLIGGKIPFKQVHANLELPRAIPFFDDNIPVDYLGEFGEIISYELLKRYDQKQVESFEKRLSEAIKENEVRSAEIRSAEGRSIDKESEPIA